MKPEPDSNFCLKFCRFEVKLVEVLSSSIMFLDLSLYLGLYLDLFKVFVI